MDRLWLAADFPKLFHVAEADAWSSIERLGLLSTAALLDLFEVQGEERLKLETEHRPDSVRLLHPKHGEVVLRDQKPLDVHALADCLNDGTTVAEWLRLLNGKVFFWATKARLTSLLGAAAYRARDHDVLTVDTRPLVEQYAAQITLTQINTGATRPARAKRGLRTFRSIALFPDEPKERRRIAEVAIDYAVPDIATYVLRVDRCRGAEVVDAIWSR
jgi:hypothetical protein